MSNYELNSQLVRAGAGTGKTENLVREVYKTFIEFKKENNKDPRLIVCTFTRKASQELKERLFKIAKEKLDEKDTLNNSSSFLNYIQSPSLHVSTIDGIFKYVFKKIWI